MADTLCITLCVFSKKKKRKKKFPRSGEAEGEKNLLAVRAEQRLPGGDTVG